MGVRTLLILFAMGVSAQSAAAQQPAAQTPPAGRGGAAAAIRSPEVLPDRRVTFRMNAPKASEVRLTCECAKDAQQLKKDERGIWSVTVGPIDPDIYEYEFTVDGVQMPDPRNISLK